MRYTCRKMTSRQERDVVRSLLRGGISLRQLAKEDNVFVTKLTLSRIVKRTSNLRYKKRETAAYIESYPESKENRLD